MFALKATAAISTAGAGFLLLFSDMTTSMLQDTCGRNQTKVVATSADYASDQKDIVDTAVAAGSFTKLAKALEAADLIEALKGEGPFTVFAPTDEAFEKLPEGALEQLLEDKDQLRAVLTYHVVPGKYKAADVVGMRSARTLQGQNITINAGDEVRVNNARVVKTDIESSNGVIHVIDTVLLPPRSDSPRQ